LKAKRTSKSKTPARRSKTRLLRPKKAALAVTKAKKAAPKKKLKAVQGSAAAMLAANPSAAEILPALSPFAALADEHSLATAWDIIGDEEYLLDDEVWNTLYNRIKLQLLQASYSFRIETDGDAISAYAVTPMPAFRADNEPGFMKTGSFTLLRPELPGVVFDLKISANDQGLMLDWLLKRNEPSFNTGHIALYCEGELIEAVNLQQGRCQLNLTRDDLGDVVFYFLDAESGKQVKILELNV
jgi:hypothetical protein